MYVCWKCQGKKQVLSTGCMFKDCNECKGIGYTKEKNERVIITPVLTMPVDDTLTIDTSVIDTQTSIPAIEFKKKQGKPRQRKSITDDNVLIGQTVIS